MIVSCDLTTRRFLSTCRVACLLVLIVLGAAAAPSFATPIPVDLSPIEPVSLAGHLELLTDPQGTLTFADVLAPAQRARFLRVAGFINRGYTKEASWVRFSFSRRDWSLDDWMLRLAPSMLDDVTVYVQTGNDPAATASYQRYIFGDHQPLSLRPVRHSSFVVPLEVSDDSPHLVYVRVQTTSSHNLSGWIYSSEQFIYWSELEGHLAGGFLGITLVVACINAICAIRLRDMLYGYYSCYVLALSASYVGVNGILPLWWPSGAPGVCDYLTGCGSALCFTFFAAFGMRLFETRPARPFAHGYLCFTALFGIVGALSVPLGWYVRVAPLLVLNGLFLVAFLVLLGLDQLRRKAPAGRLFVTAFMASNVGAVLALLRLFGATPVNWLTTYSMQVGAILSMVLMTLALTERVHVAEEQARAASREAELKAVELAREMTHELVENQRELEEALTTEREALMTKARFLEMISHEYRTPLAIIRTNLDILEMKAARAQEVFSPNIAKMKRAVARLVEVLEISLGRERLDEPHTQRGCEELRFPEFVEQVLGEMQEMWGEGRLLLEAGAGEGTVTGDPQLLKTVFLNLVDNALKYSPESRPVSIAVRFAGGYALVEVKDGGRGISADELDKVFDKYYRGPASKDTWGAGIGLHLVKKIVEQHGGQVTLESSVAGGTVATVRLPLRQREEGA